MAASTAAREAHSPTVTARILGNADDAPSAPVPANPNAAMFASVAGTSHSSPSMLVSRHGSRNAPAVSSSATGAATYANTSFTGS